MLTPQGRPLTQAVARELAGHERLVLVCGRYEGVDEKFRAKYVDEEISVGDFILSGGELPALVVMDAVVRLLPGTLGNSASAIAESHLDGLLDYPHYTRPEISAALSAVGAEAQVPAILLSGDHEAIRRWRRKQALGRTWLRRPDLLEGRELDEEAKALLDEFRRELEN